VINSDIMNSNAQLSDYWTISPRTLNEFRIGFMAEYDKLKPQTMDQGYPERLGLKFHKADVFPNINITNIYGLGSGLHANYQQNQYDISNVVTLLRGRHTLRFGGNMLRMIADSTAWGNINGATLGFTGVYTAGSNTGTLASTTGVPYADFLLGYARSWSAAVSPQYAGRLWNTALFIQDDFKVNPKLTLNLGLRWMGTKGFSDSRTETGTRVRSTPPLLIPPRVNPAPCGMASQPRTEGHRCRNRSGTTGCRDSALPICWVKRQRCAAASACTPSHGTSTRTAATD
jgi:outer membrane receptor protein involved in Fe transport